MRALEPPHAVDVHVGQRIRLLRKEAGISQKHLAGAVGLTFQQIQKYESGANRVSASKLWEFAGVLRKSIGDFYAGLPSPDEAPTVSAADGQIREIMGEPGGPDLVGAFLKMPRKTRTYFVGLARSMAEA